MQNSAKKGFRTKFLIYPRYQMTIVGFHVLVLLAALGAAAYKVRSSFNRLVQLGYDAELPANHPYFNFITLQSQEVLWGLAWVAGGTVLISVILSLILSHRLVGPIVRLRQFFKSIATADRANVQRLKFRDGDYFDDLPETINDALEHLKKSA